MKQAWFTITENTPLTADMFRIDLEGDASAVTAPGQFVNIALDGFFLRRPLSVCDWGPEALTLLYKVIGQGTEKLSAMRPGDKLDLLTGLGNGYDLAESGDSPLLIGGGAGIPPLYGLTKRLLTLGRYPSVILGFNTALEIFYAAEFRSIGVPPVITTADGSAGVHGFVTDAVPEGGYSHVYTCGPEAMLRAVYDKTTTSGQYSFEARMGCGFGACMGCSCQTKYGSKRICRDGQVLRKEEIQW